MTHIQLQPHRRRGVTNAACWRDAQLTQRGRGKTAAGPPQVIPVLQCGGGGGRAGAVRRRRRRRSLFVQWRGGANSESTNAPRWYTPWGALSYDFGTQAPFDSIAAEIVVEEQLATRHLARAWTAAGRPHTSVDRHRLSARRTWPREARTWRSRSSAPSTSTPRRYYAIRPDGAFAARTYELLRQFLTEQVDPKVRAERVSVPGYVVGTQTLLTGT